MLTTLLAALVIGQEVPVQPAKPIHSSQIATRQEERLMADGTMKTVSVTYTVNFYESFSFSMGGETVKRDFQTLSVRPESPGAKFRMERVWESDEIDDDQLFTAMNKLNGYGAPPTFGNEVFVAVQRARNIAKKNLDKFGIDIDPNKGIQGGGWTTRTYGYFQDSAAVSFSVWEEYDNGKERVSSSVDSGAFDVGNYWVPKPEPYNERFTPDGQPDKDKQVSMGGITFTPQSMGNPVQFTLPTLAGSWGSLPTSITPNQYITDVNKENGGQLIDDMKNLGFTIPQMVDILKQMAPEGTDMNRLHFPESDHPCDSDFDAPPGTMWIPSNGSYQTMMTGARFNLRNISFDLYAEIGKAAGQDSRAMRVLCMNMEKKEPASGVKYLPYRPNDPVIPALARRMDESNFRGPWDQARLWIYTDKATLEQINEKLVGGVSNSAYLMALADVGWAGGLDEKMLKDPKFINPDFMLGSGAPEYASNFLMNKLNELHPKKASDWLRKNVSSMLQLVGSDADDDDNQHLADTMRQMLNFDAPEDREAALKFIQATRQQLSGLKGKFGSGRVSLYSGRNEEVSVALALVKEGLLSPAKDALAYVAEKGPGDANKSLAKQLLGE